MAEETINQLEAAAQILMAPPNVVTNEQRHEAETIFLNFRKSRSPYEICRQILEKSQNQYVMFEAAEVIKESIIREWSFLLDSDIQSLRQYLMQYVTSRQIPHSVSERILQVVAIMVKRASIDDKGTERGAILQQVESLIMNADYDKKILGCNIITNLMQEYATSVKSTDVGLPWEVHFKAKRQFERTDLKRIFQFVVYLLSEVVRTDPPYEPAMNQLIRHLLQIAERVLVWGYFSPILHKRLISMYESVYESDNAPALKLRAEWSEIMFNPDLLPMMFQVYWKVRDIDELSHHALNCLVQLASLSGCVVNNVDDRLQYLNNYVATFLKLLSGSVVKRKESLGISRIIKKLVGFYMTDFAKLPHPLQESLLDEITQLTCQFCDGSIKEEIDPDEDTFYTDALENMLETWMTLSGEFGSVAEDLYRSCATKVFNSYVKCHLAAPDGSRPSQNFDNSRVTNDELEDNDRTKYNEQLQTIGWLGRFILPHSLPVLYRILESRIESLTVSLPVMQQRAMNINEATSLDHLFEDLHWSILIAGHVLCMESEGETALIPSEINLHCLELAKNGQCTIEASVQALRSADAEFGLVTPSDIDRCDPVIRIVYNVLKLCSLEDIALSMKLGMFLSPEVGSTLMWFLKRWCLSYLLPTEHLYHQLSPILLACMGQNSDTTQVVINFLLHKIAVNLYNFQSEGVLLNDTVELFNNMVCSPQKSVFILKTESMPKLLRLTEMVEPGTLPPNILRGVYKGLVLAGACLTDPQEMNGYYERILKPLEDKLKSLLSQANFTKICQDDRIQKIIIDLLECFIGVAKGSRRKTADTLFAFLAPILSEIHILLNIYKDYQVIVQLILEIFGQCAKYMLCYLKPLDSKKFYESSLASVQEYAKCNMNRLTTQTFAEEGSCQDLSLVLDLLTSILSKDCIDWCGETEQVETTVTASDVSLFGLKFIMPLMTLELLKFPNLCAQFYKLLVLINDIYPEKIAALPQDMMQTFLQSIELGLKNFGNDIVQACLDFVQGMAMFLVRYQSLDTPFAHALKPFLKLIMDLVLTQQINSDLISIASTTIYTLICCYQEEYQGLVQGLIQSQTDSLVADRLASAFTTLMFNVHLKCDRPSKLKFRDNFDRFIANVHGFLLIK